jgi:glycine betaine/proline transport system ATP-binding protein
MMAIVRPPNGPVPVVDGDGRLLGIIGNPAGLGSSPAEWKKHLSQDFIRLKPETLIAPFLDELARNERPLVVEHEDGTFAGIVTGHSVLQALASNSAIEHRQGKPESYNLQPGIAPGRAKEQRSG